MKERKVFQNSIAPIPVASGMALNGLIVNAATPEHLREKMTIHFSFGMPDEARKQLEERVEKGETVSPDELKKKYAPKPGELEKLSNWLKKEGFEILPVSHDGSSIYARATAAQIEKSLQVKMIRVLREGIAYTSAQNAPSLPLEVSQSVHAIIGLQPFRQAHKNFRIYHPANPNRIQTVRGFTTDGPSPAIANKPPYLVPEILKAYGADNLSVTGKDQIIAILIDTFPLSKDLKAFWKANQVSCTLKQITRIRVKGGHVPAPEGEETLDTSWTSGIAPGAKIRIYATGSLQFVDIDMALDRIIADLKKYPNMRQVSISLGLGEQYMGGADNEIATQHVKYLKLAAAGVNVFVSSGDAGSNPDGSGHGSTGPLQVEYAASDPCVVGVGGTTLSLDANGSVSDESGWTSGGGGKSMFFTRPAWQSGTGVPNENKRYVPDVSMTADPNDGAYLVLHGQVMQIGGTSWSAPIWAGFCALINEYRQTKGQQLLPFLNPFLYPLIGTTSFRDIKHGNNGAYKAGNGYDMVTGIGVPVVKNLMEMLIK